MLEQKTPCRTIVSSLAIDAGIPEDLSIPPAL